MFCNNCGSELADNTKFCSECGANLSGDASAANEKKKVDFGPVDPKSLSPADELSYMIHGDDMQLLEVFLEPGRGVVADTGAMTYIDHRVEMDAIFGDGSKVNEDAGFMGKLVQGGKRALAGESLFMTSFQNISDEKALAAFAAPYPGKILPVELKEFDNQLICQKQAFLCAARGVSIDIYIHKKIGAGLFGGEGFIMERIVGDGLVFLHAGGTIIKKELKDGETLRVDTGCIVAMDYTVNYDVTFASNIKTGLFGGEGLFLATLTGPGTVWLQSLPFSRIASRIHSFDKADERKGLNNPIGEITGGIGGALGNLFKN